MSHSLELKEGAFVIADAHYSHLRPQLLSFFQDIHFQKLQPTQLILMGDVFDALFGSIEYTYEQNREILTILQSIAQTIEVIFLEGNHDFNLKNIFTNIKVFPLKEQPVLGEFNGKKIALAHGDFDAPFGYQLYTSIIRSTIVLKVLNFLDKRIGNKIIKKIDAHLGKKDDCQKFTGFREYIEKRHLEKYNVKYFIEGHFHQDKVLKFTDYSYINLAAFACNQRYFIVKSSKDKELYLEKNSH